MLEHYGFDEFFIHNISDIFLARALRNNQIVYDGQITNNLMGVFGKKVKHLGEVSSDSFAVVNSGELLKRARKIANESEVLKYEEVLASWGLDEQFLNQYGTPLVKIDESI